MSRASEECCLSAPNCLSARQCLLALKCLSARQFLSASNCPVSRSPDEAEYRFVPEDILCRCRWVDLVPFVLLPAGQLLAVLWLPARLQADPRLAARQFAALRAAVPQFAALRAAARQFAALRVAKNAHSIRLIVTRILLFMLFSLMLAAV